MKHIYFTSLLTIFFSMVGVKAFAYDAEIDGIYYNFNGTEATLTNGDNSYSGEIVIPLSVDHDGKTYDVTSIGREAFAGCSGLTSITIPNSVTSIGSSAFSGCSDLTSITIPNSVASIGQSAFYECWGLTSITIPKSVTSIDDFAFEYCYLKSIVVEESNPVYDSRNGCNAIIETASNTLILGCPNTTIPNSVTAIGYHAFSTCYDLTSFTIPNSVTSIGEGAFNDCWGLTSVTIPNSVTSIGNSAFIGCYALTTIVVEEGNTKYDSRNSCNAIIETSSNTLITGCKNTTIPEGVTAIGEYAFMCCGSLTSITIPGSVTSIGLQAFYLCNSLTSITIPESVTTIENSAFHGTPWYDNQPDGLVYAGKVAYGYKGAMPENTTIEIKKGTLGIAGDAFLNGNNLTSITLPESVTNIGDRAFWGCSGLTSINIPENVASIGKEAFSGCCGLTFFTISNSVTTIGKGAFSGCHGLTSITIPESVTSIGEYAFYFCDGLTSIKVDMKSPIAISPRTFPFYNNSTLYVPKGSKTAFEAADYWNECKEIVECNYVDVEDQIIVAGQSETMDISVNTKPHNNLVGFQLDFTLPEGVSLDKAGCSLSSRITDEEQKLTIGKLESGAYRLTSTSLSLTPISDTDGTLLTLKLTTTKDCVDGKATISNIVFSTDDSQRVTMDDESFDITIYYTYKLSYVVDGEVYLTDSVVYKTPLILETEPTKAGYTFGGWSELPEIMPNHDVEITGRFYLFGDVNTDEEVDVVDVVDIARFVVATPSDSFRERLADLNYDATVNIADAVTLVNHIAGDQNFVKAAQAIGTTYDYAQCQLLLQNTGQKALSFSLNGDADFTAFQFEIELPANTDISAMRINGQRNNGHQLLYNKVSDNRYRVVALSLSNAIFNGNKGELLNISIDGLTMDDVCIHDIHFVTINGTDVTFDSLNLSGNETSIADVDVTEGCTIYDLQGRRRNTLQRGLNIVGNKAYIKK